MDSGSGVHQAWAMKAYLSEWGIVKSVQALCCDTGAPNLGCMNGAAVNLERLLVRDLLWLPCKHHILE